MKLKKPKFWELDKPNLLAYLLFPFTIFAELNNYFLNKKTKHFLINVGSGIEKTIKDYAKIVSKVLNTKINIIYVKKNLNGTPRKLLDLSLSKKYGWKSKLKLIPSIKKTYEDFIKNLDEN